MTITQNDADSRIKTTIVPVDADTAARWLNQNIRNRPLSKSVVDRYRRDMAEGRWAFAGDPIRFDISGTLLDGQHRLAALAETEGLTIPFVVIRGLPTESQMVMDQGRKRTPGQQLGLLGMKNATHVAAGTKVFLAWRGGYLFRDNAVATSHLTTAEIERFVAENAELIERVNAYANSLRAPDAPPSVSWAAAMAFDALHPDLAHDFFVHLQQGGQPLGSPINTLDKRLQRIRREGLKLSNRDYLALFVQAWNAWRDGKSVQKFQKPRGGKWTADNFPEPR